MPTQNYSKCTLQKFRQLLDHINIYEEYLEQKKEDSSIIVNGILFGNTSRLKDIDDREESFTTSCLERANKKGIILIRTSDLYKPIMYLIENNDNGYKKLCRDTIHNSLGKVVEFPQIPNIQK